MFVAPPPRCQVLLLDLDDEGLCTALRHELFWSRLGQTGARAVAALAAVPKDQPESVLSALEQAKQGGAICVARLRKPDAHKRAFATRIGGIAHIVVISDAQMNDLAAGLRAHIALPQDAAIAQLRPMPRPEGAPVFAALTACRPHQWIKNLLVFVPLLAAHQINLIALGHALLAFFAFCAVASAVYLLNDLLDLDADRQHARKRLRPFASGDLPLYWAPWLLGGTLAIGVALGAMVGAQFLAVLALYAGVTTAYSLGLKRVVIVDITVLAGLYTLRILAGGVATEITLSLWLLAFSMFLFLALAAIKRLAELVEVQGQPDTCVPGRGYRTADLPFVAMLAVASGHVAVLVLALYVNSPDIRLLYGTPAALWVACVVLYCWTMRLVLMAYRGQIMEDPVVFATRDISSWTCAALLAAAVILASLAPSMLPWPLP